MDFGSVSTGFGVQIAKSGMKIVMWPDELWPDHSCCRMLAKTDWMNANNDKLYRLLRAYLRAERDMHAENGMEEVVNLTMKNLDMSEETARSFLQSPHMKYETDPYKNSVITMWNKMKGFGYIADPGIKIENHINTDIYKSALQSLLAENPEDAFYREKLAMFTKHNL